MFINRFKEFRRDRKKPKMEATDTENTPPPPLKATKARGQKRERTIEGKSPN